MTDGSRPSPPSRQSVPPPWPCPGWSGSDDGPWVWVPAREDWKAGGGPYTCRDRGCLRPAVMRLNRWQHRRGKGRIPMWWHYCAEHSYSRVVHDGVVWQPGRPEAIEPSGNAPTPESAS